MLNLFFEFFFFLFLLYFFFFLLIFLKIYQNENTSGGKGMGSVWIKK